MERRIAPRYTVTDDEDIRLTQICNDFWHAFSALIASSLDQCPTPDLEDLLLMKLGEHSSVYGSEYEKYRTEKP
jgi:hypothetical protein